MHEKVLLIGVNINDDQRFESSMQELKGLAKANNFKVEGMLTQNLKMPQKKYYIGIGKINILKAMIEEQNIEAIIFDNELTPLQYRNLELELKIRIFDRTMLILDIFASRAKSKEAKLQVEVARLNYMLPRLNVTNDNMSQQAGGGFKNKGAGEKQIDIDKRTLRKRISDLQEELEELEENRKNSRKLRNKSNIPLVAIVGYTNSGKSTLLNAFIEEYGVNSKSVMAKDMLFATLDTTVRHIKPKNNKEFLLSDTVGFISSLPTGLVSAFRSTLAEVSNADLILLVSDISNPDVLEHINVTLDTLDELEISNIPIIYVFNKADKVGLATIPNDGNKVFISAKNHLNLNLLKNEIERVIFADWEKCVMLIPYENYNVFSYLKENANILDVENKDEGVFVTVELSKKDFIYLNEYIWVKDKN